MGPIKDFEMLVELIDEKIANRPYVDLYHHDLDHLSVKEIEELLSNIKPFVKVSLHIELNRRVPLNTLMLCERVIHGSNVIKDRDIRKVQD